MAISSVRSASTVPSISPSPDIQSRPSYTSSVFLHILRRLWSTPVLSPSSPMAISSVLNASTVPSISSPPDIQSRPSHTSSYFSTHSSPLTVNSGSLSPSSPMAISSVLNASTVPAISPPHLQRLSDSFSDSFYTFFAAYGQLRFSLSLVSYGGIICFERVYRIINIPSPNIHLRPSHTSSVFLHILHCLQPTPVLSESLPRLPWQYHLF
ncbi:hypothetical protein V8E52_008796 [Russula decolorans]|jgi:hypothetical protein